MLSRSDYDLLSLFRNGQPVSLSCFDDLGLDRVDALVKSGLLEYHDIDITAIPGLYCVNNDAAKITPFGLDALSEFDHEQDLQHKRNKHDRNRKIFDASMAVVAVLGLVVAIVSFVFSP